MTSIEKRPYYKNLDGLRSVAFLMVFLNHTVYGYFKMNITDPFLGAVAKLFCDGGIGVSVFFVLSGYLITTLLLEEINEKGEINIVKFYSRRTLRIWPLYFALLVIVFVVYPLAKKAYGLDIQDCYREGYYISFLSNFDIINIRKNCPWHGALSTSVTWSIAIEEQFYLCWPLFFLFINKKYFPYIFIVSIAVSVFFRMIHQEDTTVLYYHTLAVYMDFSIGGAVAYLVLYHHSFRGKIVAMSRVVLVAVYCAGFCWLFLLNFPIALPYWKALTRVFSSCFFAFIILEQNFSLNSFFKFSNNTTLTYWGKYTYGLYLLHPLIVHIILFVMSKKIGLSENTLLYTCLSLFSGLILSMCVSYLSYRYFESPFLRLKEKMHGA